MRFDGKVALISGAGSGIGRAHRADRHALADPVAVKREAAA